MGGHNQKSIGIIGGMSWESTVTYYQGLNRGIAQRLGGLHSANLVVSSVDFGPISELQHQGKWALMGEQLANRAKQLETAGVEGIVLATNTMHKVAPAIETAVDIPFLHLLDALVAQCHEQGIDKVGLLGTGFTMEDGFYQTHLAQHDIDVLTPNSELRSEVHRVIYEELCKGIILNSSKTTYLRAVEQLASAGAQAVVLGCTEIGLLIQQGDTSTTLLDTTSIHVNYALDFMVSQQS